MKIKIETLCGKFRRLGFRARLLPNVPRALPFLHNKAKTFYSKIVKIVTLKLNIFRISWPNKQMLQADACYLLRSH